MDHNTRNHIAHAADALAATGARTSQRATTDQLIIALSDLATIAGLLGQLATQTRWQLAARAVVGAHLRQAEQYAENLSQSLKNACATFAFNSSPNTAA